MTPKNDREMEWNMAFGSLIWCLVMLMLLVTMGYLNSLERPSGPLLFQ